MCLLFVDFRKHVFRPLVGQRHLFDDPAHLFKQCFFAQIFLVTLALLLCAAVIDVSLLPLGSDRAGALSARHQFRENVLVFSPSLLPRSSRDHYLHIVEQVLTNDRLVRTIEKFALARNHPVVDRIL
ncbi:MAG: hypothetical protein Q7S29_03420 [Candidatus Peribacter sp.]|nr:hypothetical protein [Candidatus Peribacter sp.]